MWFPGCPVFALTIAQVAPYLNVARDAYEGYALWCFFALLLAYVEGESGDCGLLLARKPPVRHPLPLCFLPPVQAGPVFVLWTKRVVLQFAIIKPLVAVLSLVLQPLGLLGEQNFSPTRAYLYFTIITNVSVFFALWFLVLFYLAARDELKRFSPVGKFLAIKSILFFTFWQQMLISVLNHYEVLTGIGAWTQREFSVGLQDFAICVEMFLLSIVHIFVFEFQSYVQPVSAVLDTRFVAWQMFRPVVRNFAATVSQRDVLSQAREVLRRDASMTARKQQDALLSGSEDDGDGKQT